MTIGERIKNRREDLNLSQMDLAIKLGYKSRSSVNKIELGLQNLTQSKIKAVADALDTTPAYIMGWEEISPTPISESEGRNVIRIAGRDGSYIEKRLTDEQASAWMAIIEQLPDADDL